MEEEYSTESESSDDDYNPALEKAEQLSEIDTDDDDAEVEDGDDNGDKNNKSTSRKRSKKQSNKMNKRNKKAEDSGGDEASDDDKDGSAVVQPAANEDDEKKRADALWANFLDDADPPPPPPKVITKPTEVISKTPITTSTKPTTELLKEKTNCVANKHPETITKIFDFAGEQVKIVTEAKPTNGVVSTSGINNGKPAPIANKRQSGGLGSILGQLGKKNKITTLEKSKLDWEGFKQKEGIDDEIQTHNKGKSGYLERQDFLERTDLRQFAQEKSLRQTKRNNR